MNSHDLLLVGLPAGLTGLGAYLAARFQFRSRPGEASDQIASAFSRLVNELQEENAKHLASIATLRADAHSMRNQLMKLQAFASALFKHIATLEQQVIGLGAVPASRPALPDPN